MVDWFLATLKSYPEIAIFLTLAIGFYFGKFKFKGIGLGADRKSTRLNSSH